MMIAVLRWGLEARSIEFKKNMGTRKNRRQTQLVDEWQAKGFRKRRKKTYLLESIVSLRVSCVFPVSMLIKPRTLDPQNGAFRCLKANHERSNGLHGFK